MSSARSPEGTYRDKIDMEQWQRYLWAFDELIQATNQSDQRRMRIARAIMFNELWADRSRGPAPVVELDDWRGRSGGRS
jgi:hypothetical protein